MRKSMVLLAALFVLAGVQDAAAQQNMLGAKVGFIAAELSGDIEDDLASRTGLAFGAFLQVRVGQNFSIQPEALYLAKGASEDAGDGEVAVDYLQVPILIQYHFTTAGISPRLFAGPSIAFELGCDFSEDDVSIDCEDAAINTKSADFGLVFGGGLDIPLGPVVVTGDVRYDLGVTNVVDDVDGFDDVEVKNRAWEILAGVGFPFGP